MNQCPLHEDFFTPTFQLLIQHIGQVHSKSSDFHLTCGVDNCQTTYTNFAAFKRYLRKKHWNCLHETLITPEVQTCDSFQEEDVTVGDPLLNEGVIICFHQFWHVYFVCALHWTSTLAMQASFWLSRGKDDDWSTLDTSSERSQTYPVMRWGAAGWRHWFVQCFRGRWWRPLAGLEEDEDELKLEENETSWTIAS